MTKIPHQNAGKANILQGQKTDCLRQLVVGCSLVSRTTEQAHQAPPFPSCFLNCRGTFYPGISGFSLQASFLLPPTKRPFFQLLGNLILTYDTPIPTPTPTAPLQPRPLCPLCFLFLWKQRSSDASRLPTLPLGIPWYPHA